MSTTSRATGLGLKMKCSWVIVEYHHAEGQVDLEGVDGLGHAAVALQDAQHALEVGDRRDYREVRRAGDE